MFCNINITDAIFIGSDREAIFIVVNFNVMCVRSQKKDARVMNVVSHLIGANSFDSLYAAKSIYWVLSLLWGIIAILFIAQFRAEHLQYPTLSVLIAILAIDSFRTFFESLYFGLFFNSYLGIIAPKFHEFLGNPAYLIIPKVFNLISGLLVLYFLVFRLVATVNIESEIRAAAKAHKVNLKLFKLLEEERDKLRTVQTIVNLGYWETNLDSFDVIWSTETYRIFGLAPEVFSPTHSAFLSRVHPDDRTAVDDAFRGSLDSTDIMSIEHRIILPDGSVKYVIERWQSKRMENAENRYVLGTCQDITELKKRELLIKQSQRMDAIGRLTSGIAHDFKNLLTVVSINAEILNRPGLKIDDVHQATNAIIAAADRGNQFVKRLLVFAMDENYELNIVNMNSLISGLEILRLHAMGENIKFEQSFCENLWLVEIDSKLMENALINLYINAGEAMPNGGTLNVVTSNLTLAPSDADVMPKTTPGEYVSITISDNGFGMDRFTLEHIFEPFFSTKPSKMGGGLGLGMVFGFIKKSKGQIHVSSQLGVGSIFNILIPRAKEKPEDIEQIQ